MGSEDPSHQTHSSNFLAIRASKLQSETTPNSINNILSPMRNYKGSALYDSFELQQVVHQLNKAIQGSKPFSPAYVCNRKRLNRLYVGNKSSPNKTLKCSNFSSRLDSKTVDNNVYKGAWIVTGRVVTRLWKKVKQRLLRNKQKE